MHAYDAFVSQIRQKPLEFAAEIADDGIEAGQGEILRAVRRVEFGGMRRSGRKQTGRWIPIVREVLSCGHWIVTGAGSFNWQRPHRTAGCSECGERMLPARGSRSAVKRLS